MKEKLWNELKIMLCAKEKWMKDESSNKCQCCGKSFNLMRRRHHCRFCGKLYCNDCSDLYINGHYLGLSERFVRHCEFCKEQIQKVKRDLNKFTFMVHDQQQFKNEDSSDSENQDSQQNNEDDYEYAFELQAQAMNLYTKMFKRCVELGRIKRQFGESNLLAILLTIVNESKMNILPNRQNSEDKYMDIIEQLGIKIITGQPAQTLELINGIVLEKSLPLKSMLDFLVNPQIILFENSLDESLAKIKFQDLICNERLIYQQLEQKIMKLNPDIIFVEKHVSREMINFFSEKGITVISGLDKKFMNQIMAFAGIRHPIKNIWNVDKLKPSNMIGTIDLMRLNKFQSNETLIYFEKNMGIRTLVISEQAGEAQTVLKKNLQFLIKMIRQITLERFLIHLDYQMWQDKAGFNVFRLYKLNPSYLYLFQKMKYQSIQFYRMKLSQINLQQDDKKIREYCKSKGKNYLLNFCGQTIEKQIIAYEQHDCTIGYFLLAMAATFLQKCSQCNAHHRERYYFNNYGVEININSLKDHYSEKKSEKDDELTKQKLDQILYKYKENSNVFSYFQCKECHSIISKRVKIGKNYLKNSFYYFLYVATNSNEWNGDEQMKISYKVDSVDSKNDCNHTFLYRVLETSDIILKMQPFPITKYKLTFINLSTPTYSILYKHKLKKFIIERIETEYINKQNFIASLNMFINGYIAILYELKSQNSADYKILLEIQKLQNIEGILQEIRVYIERVYCKWKSEEIGESFDWTYFERDMGKINYVLNIIIHIIQHTENILQKNKKKIEENNILSVQKSEANSIFEEPLDNLRLKRQDQSKTSIEYKVNQFQTAKFQTNITQDQHFADIEVPQFSEKGKSRSQESNFDKTSFSYRKQSINNYLYNLNEQQDRVDKQSDGQSVSSRKATVSNFTFNLVEQQDKFRSFVKDMTKKRYQLYKGKYLYYTILNYKNPISVLVCALNSVQFSDQFQKKGSVNFKFNLIISNTIHTKWQIKSRIEKIRNEIQEQGNQEQRQSYEIIAYHHREFQEFRQMEGLKEDVFIKSLANCQFWNASGGKSKSIFSKSNDDILVVKTVKQEEFVQFQKFTSDYLKHIKEGRQFGSGSYLAKIYGIYELSIRGKSYKCVVMKNLLFGLYIDELTIYDLKGSELNRLVFQKLGQKKITGLDTNFKIDKNYHPFSLQGKHSVDFMEHIKKDIDFLAKNEVIDYSVLVIENEREIRIGIIDFMRPYHLKQKFENIYKEIYYGVEPTVLPPQEYSSRFFSAIKKYFIIGNSPHSTQNLLIS